MRTFLFCNVLFMIMAVNAWASPIRVACIGNSITQGTAYGTSYTVRLATLLGSGYTVENDGIANATVLKSGDYPYWIRGKLAAVFALKPDIVTIKLGTNDSKANNWVDSANFVRDLTSLVDTISAISSHPQIWLCLPCPSWYTVVGSINGATIKNSIIPRIRQVAAAKGLNVIDLNTPFANLPELFPDAVHPNNEGEDTIAAIIFRAIAGSTFVHSGAQTSRSDNQNAANVKLMAEKAGSYTAEADFYDLKGQLVVRKSGFYPLRRMYLFISLNR